jgi:hypothetical protein
MASAVIDVILGAVILSSDKRAYQEQSAFRRDDDDEFA